MLLWRLILFLFPVLDWRIESQESLVMLRPIYLLHGSSDVYCEVFKEMIVLLVKHSMATLYLTRLKQNRLLDNIIYFRKFLQDQRVINSRQGCDSLQIVIDIRKADVLLNAKQKLFNIKAFIYFLLNCLNHYYAGIILEHLSHHPQQFIDITNRFIAEHWKSMYTQTLLLFVMLMKTMPIFMHTLVSAPMVQQLYLNVDLL